MRENVDWNLKVANIMSVRPKREGKEGRPNAFWVKAVYCNHGEGIIFLLIRLIVVNNDGKGAIGYPSQ